MAAAALLGLGSLSRPAQAAELVRVLISQFDGSEPASISSASHPQLFVLDSSIASVELTATNPNAPFKDPDLPGTWRPQMAPNPPAPIPGTIDLTIVPQVGSPVTVAGIAFRASALFAANPSSFVLRSSLDGFAQPLAVIDLGQTKTSLVALNGTPSDQPVVLRWTAGNDFGENGGGSAGFAGADVVVSSALLCGAAPASGCLAAPKGAVKLVRNANPSKQSLSWSWTNGTTSGAAFGDPVLSTAFGLCIYDDGALVAQSTVSPTDSCGKKACWKAQKGGTGFSYDNAKGNPAGIRSVKLKAGTGKAAISVAGRGASLGLPLPLAGTSGVTVQLVRSDDPGCFESVFAAPATKSDALHFSDKLP